MAPPRPSRYAWWPLEVVDGVCVALTAPLTHTVSLAGSCYCLTTRDNPSLGMLFLRFAVVGPILVILSFLAFLPGLLGWLLWVTLNTQAAHLIQPFQYHTRHTSPTQPSAQPLSVTLCSANILLCPEVISRFNNCPNVWWRVKQIATRFLHQDKGLNLCHNLEAPVCRDKVVVTQLPEVDVFVVQEVMERWQARAVVRLLGDRYPHCVYDVGLHSAASNFFLCGSGLFLASKYPVLDAAFHPYSCYIHYGCVVGLGVLLAKLDLGVVVRGGREVAGVGYVANTHTQAFEGEKSIVSRQLGEAHEVFEQYMRDTHRPHSEVVMFAVMGGDFNADNISKGDQAVQNLPLFDEYEDPCVVVPGQDAAWTVGTEHRQKLLHHPSTTHPSTFRSVLLDDVMRRHFMLDADVESSTLELMRSAPRPDADGQVRAVTEGGRRRIDKLVVKRGGEMAPVGYWFSTVIAGLTDHLPVVMMLQERERAKEGCLEGGDGMGEGGEGRGGGDGMGIEVVEKKEDEVREKKSV